MRIMVCGAEDWMDEATVQREIMLLAPGVVLHTAAPGFGAIVAYVATMAACVEGRSLVVVPFHADPTRDGKLAEAFRDSRMIAEGRPHQGLAFGPLYQPMAQGTHRRTDLGDVVAKMIDAHVPVRWIPDPDSTAQDLVEMPPPMPTRQEGG